MIFSLSQIPVKTEADVGPMEPLPKNDLPPDNLPVPISSIKEEDINIDITTVHDMPIKVCSVSRFPQYDDTFR